jgi:hypothetical protein
MKTVSDSTSFGNVTSAMGEDLLGACAVRPKQSGTDFHSSAEENGRHASHSLT